MLSDDLDSDDDDDDDDESEPVPATSRGKKSAKRPGGPISNRYGGLFSDCLVARAMLLISPLFSSITCRNQCEVARLQIKVYSREHLYLWINNIK